MIPFPCHKVSTVLESGATGIYVFTCLTDIAYIVTYLSSHILPFSSAYMAYWVRVWDFLVHGHAMQEVGGSNGTIVGGVLHLTGQLARFSLPPNMPSFVNSKFI